DRAALLMGCGLLTLLWIAAPALAAYLNNPPVREERRVAPRLRGAALRYALLHWSFFERFVTEDTHWLAPDNFQETPAPVVAMRTSPTNIGLQLLATVSAHDLGFLDLEEMATRLERVMDTLGRLRRFRGHFYNWYDLRTLEDLAPGYISTVDSGNLAGHLIAVRQACLETIDAPVLDRRIWSAMETAVGLFVESTPAARPGAELAAARASARRRAGRPRRGRHPAQPGGAPGLGGHAPPSGGDRLAGMEPAAGGGSAAPHRGSRAPRRSGPGGLGGSSSPVAAAAGGGNGTVATAPGTAGAERRALRR